MAFACRSVSTPLFFTFCITLALVRCQNPELGAKCSADLELVKADEAVMAAYAATAAELIECLADQLAGLRTELTCASNSLPIRSACSGVAVLPEGRTASACNFGITIPRLRPDPLNTTFELQLLVQGAYCIPNVCSDEDKELVMQDYTDALAFCNFLFAPGGCEYVLNCSIGAAQTAYMAASAATVGTAAVAFAVWATKKQAIASVAKVGSSTVKGKAALAGYQPVGSLSGGGGALPPGADPNFRAIMSP